MELSGHRDIRMLQHYSHTKEEAKRSAVEKLKNGLNFEIMDTYLDTKAKNQENSKTNIMNLTPRNQ